MQNASVSNGYITCVRYNLCNLVSLCFGLRNCVCVFMCVLWCSCLNIKTRFVSLADPRLIGAVVRCMHVCFDICISISIVCSVNKCGSLDCTLFNNVVSRTLTKKIIKKIMLKPLISQKWTHF